MAYLAGAWFLVESFNLVVDRFHWPEVIGQIAIILATVGFFITLVLAWYHGEKGQQRVSGPELLLIAALLVIAGGVLATLSGGGEGTQRGVIAAFQEIEDDRPSVAALPWSNRSGREEDLYFTDGVHDEILTRLAKVGGLRVIARQSVMKFRDSPSTMREIAEELGVRYILEAGLLRAKDTVRINVQLIDTQVDDHKWAETYDHALSMENLLSVASEVAQKVAAEMKAVLSPEEKERIETPLTDNLEAYDLYLLGRYRLVPRSAENIHLASDYYEAALEQDSTFGQAWAGLAMAWAILPFYEPFPSREAYARGREAALRALDLDDGLAEAHAALGALALYHEWDLESAEGHLLRAIELDRNYPETYLWLGTAQCLRGQPELAVESLREGVRLNPLAENFRAVLDFSLICAGRVEEALEGTFGEGKGDDIVNPFYLPVLLQQGWDEEAVGMLRRWAENAGYSDPERLDLVVRAFHAPELAEEAVRLVRHFQRTTETKATHFALLYFLFDARPDFLRSVQEAIAAREVEFIHIGPMVGREGLMKYPELAATLEAVGIPFR